MRRFLIIAGLVAFAVVPAAAQEIEVVLKDGNSIVGTWQGVREGKYLVDAHGELMQIPELDVQFMRLLGDPVRPGQPPVTPHVEVMGRQEFAAIEMLIRQKKFDEAALRLEALMEQINRMEQNARLLTYRLHMEQVLSMIERRDVDGMVQAIQKMRLLPDSTQQSLMDVLVRKIQEHLRNAPTATFTHNLCKAVASYLSSETPIRDKEKEHLIKLLRTIADEQYKAGRYDVAAEIYLGLIRFEAALDSELKARAREAFLANVRQLRERSQFTMALNAVERFLETFQGDEEGLTLSREIEFLRLQHAVNTKFPSQAIRELMVFLEKPHPEEYEKWAREKLEVLQAKSGDMPELAVEIQKYYPIEVGRWMLYQRDDESFKEKIWVDSIEIEEGIVSVYHTIEELYRNWSTKKVYQVFIDKTRVYRLNGDQEEVLLQFPAYPGQSWSWRHKNQRFVRTIKSTNATVHLPEVGTFTDCLEVEFESVSEGPTSDTSISSTSYYAPGVGLVKLVFHQHKYKRYGMELIGTGQDLER